MARKPRKCNRKPSLIATGGDSDFSDSSSDDDAYIPTDDDLTVGSDSDTVEEQAVRAAVNLLLEAWHEVGVDHLQEVPPEEGTNVDNGTTEVPIKVGPVRKKRGRKEREGPPLLWEVWEDEHENWIDENLEKDSDLDGQNDIIPETADPSSDLIIPLLRYQKEWLAWAFRQEESPSKGGILADEMGMGKTAQAIALVLAKRERCGIDWSAAPGPSTGLARIKATLVICPVVAVSQWVSEIDRFTTKGSTTVLVYHGANRGRTVDQFEQYDFVITTYSLVEAEFRKFVLPPRKKCRYCGKLLHKEKLVVHLKYFCGPDAIKTTKQAKQMTRKKAWSKKGKASAEDIGTISDFEDEKTSSGKSPLHSLKWERIILDEAHFIKDRQCSTAKAVLALQSSFKWALSGTPLQNRVGELYSLIRFLQIVPYSYYLCKDCDCRTLDYGASKQCMDCPHSSVRHFCWWNRNVANPIQSRGNLDEGRRAMILLKHKVLRSILLRRTKKGRAADLALPPRIVMLRRDALDVREEDYYISLYNESQAQFTTYVEAGTVMNNYAHIFDLLTRLRQAVDHPYLVVYSAAAARRNEEVSTDKSEEICSVCDNPSEDTFVTACEHVICKFCLDFSAPDLGQISCPICSKPLTVDFSTRSSSTPEKPKITKVKGFKSTSILNRIRLEEFQTSTKIEALREEIMFMVERDGSAKGIVFSQFTSFLDLINYSLQQCGIGCVQLTGDMSIAARDSSIKKFTEDPECRIFLVSLKAGGVALNLTVASHVFVMDPWWNPAVEKQAQDRIHRIGQYKPIRIVRFVIENTIEERILKLQEKKELVFEGTVGGSAEALGKLTESDLRFLFTT